MTCCVPWTRTQAKVNKASTPHFTLSILQEICITLCQQLIGKMELSRRQQPIKCKVQHFFSSQLNTLGTTRNCQLNSTRRHRSARTSSKTLMIRTRRPQILEFSQRACLERLRARELIPKTEVQLVQPTKRHFLLAQSTLLRTCCCGTSSNLRSDNEPARSY